MANRQIVQHARAVEQESIPFALYCDLLWVEKHARYLTARHVGLDLRFYRFAIPPARHGSIIRCCKVNNDIE